jgi:TolA-binding protein
LKKGQYDLAVEQLKEFSSNDELLVALAYTGIADANVELNQLDNACSYYAKAAAKSPNAFTAPIALLKLGITYEQLNENQKAVDTYNKIKKEFADTNEARDIDKYIARASAKI